MHFNSGQLYYRGFETPPAGHPAAMAAADLIRMAEKRAFLPILAFMSEARFMSSFRDPEGDILRDGKRYIDYPPSCFVFASVYDEVSATLMCGRASLPILRTAMQFRKIDQPKIPHSALTIRKATKDGSKPVDVPFDLACRKLSEILGAADDPLETYKRLLDLRQNVTRPTMMGKGPARRLNQRDGAGDYPDDLFMLDAIRESLAPPPSEFPLRDACYRYYMLEYRRWASRPNPPPVLGEEGSGMVMAYSLPGKAIWTDDWIGEQPSFAALLFGQRLMRAPDPHLIHSHRMKVEQALYRLKQLQMRISSLRSLIADMKSDDAISSVASVLRIDPDVLSEIISYPSTVQLPKIAQGRYVGGQVCEDYAVNSTDVEHAKRAVCLVWGAVRRYIPNPDSFQVTLTFHDSLLHVPAGDTYGVMLFPKQTLELKRVERTESRFAPEPRPAWQQSKQDLAYV